MKVASMLRSLLLLAGLSSVVSDPPPPVDPAFAKVFCFRITDIRCDPDVEDRFLFEFEVLNWSDSFVGGMQLSMAQGSTRDLLFVEEDEFNGIDSDLRPLKPVDVNGDGSINALDDEDSNNNGIVDPGEDVNGNERLDNDPIPGNLNRPNTWMLTKQTESQMIWELGDAIPYINLIQANDANQGASCFPPGAVDPVSGEISPRELIDNGDNVQDGFVMTIDNFHVGDVAHINWALLGAGSATTPFTNILPNVCRGGGTTPFGALIDNVMGSGLVSITRFNETLPGPVFQGQTGFRTTNVEFFDSVWNVPDNNDTSIIKATFASEFSPTIVASFCIPSDNQLNQNINAISTGPLNTNCGGDPHFVTWSQKRFNYHGECDLVLASSKGFQDGTGLDVHLRTKIEDIYSIVTAVGVKKGKSIFEFNHEKQGEFKFYVNKVEVPELPFTDEDFSVTMHEIHNEDFNESVKVFTIDLGQGSLVRIDVLFQWVFVDISAPGKDVAGSTGLSGSYPAGKMLARDGVTDLEDDRNAYGGEWQVQADEPQLFFSTSADHPQAPHATCKLPSVDAHQYLRANKSEMYHTAMEACIKEGVTGADLEDCIFDVSVLSNPKIAAAWWGKEKVEEEE